MILLDLMPLMLRRFPIPNCSANMVSYFQVLALVSHVEIQAPSIRFGVGRVIPGRPTRFAVDHICD
jgi:hypothetical protein